MKFLICWSLKRRKVLSPWTRPKTFSLSFADESRASSCARCDWFIILMFCHFNGTRGLKQQWRRHSFKCFLSTINWTLREMGFVRRGGIICRRCKGRKIAWSAVQLTYICARKGDVSDAITWPAGQHLGILGPISDTDLSRTVKWPSPLMIRMGLPWPCHHSHFFTLKWR
jgi:hypothetical protein